VNNSPVQYTDPSGRFTEDAIYNYLLNNCDNDSACADDLLAQWQADTEWWDMITTAQAGDILFGIWQHEGEGVTHSFYYRFEGEGIDVLTGISVVNANSGEIMPTNQTLIDIQQGTGIADTPISASGYFSSNVTFRWSGIARPGQRPDDFPYLRPGAIVVNYGAPSKVAAFINKWIIGFAPGFLACGGGGSGLVCGILATILGDAANDAFNLEPQDYALSVDGVYFNFQVSSNPGNEWSIEDPLTR
jgi:hypothetical protein